MFIKAILEVDEDKLEEMDSTFETEMGWVEQSGIYLQSYEEVDVMDLLSEKECVVMPNWCYTNITINHESKTEIEKLEKLINEWTSKDYMENGFGNKWLGNVVLGSGVGTVDADNATDLRCRGTIIDYYRTGSQLVVSTETAWSPMLKMWVKVLEKYLPDAELIYNADECGFDINDTNDPELVGKYIIDYWGDGDIEPDYEASEEVTRKILQELLDTTETNIEKLIQMVYEDDYDISVRKWEYSDVSNWD